MAGKVFPARWMERLTDGILPLRCPLCGKGLTADGTCGMFCRECLAEMPFIHGKPCPSCGGEAGGIFGICAECLELPKRPWRKAYALFRYEDKVRETVRLFKYGKRADLARPLGHLCAGILPEEERKWACVTYVPLHWMRYLQRGYNQSELLAGITAGECGIPCRRLLRRTRNTPHQAFLPKKERLENLKGAFSVCGSTFPQGGSILLVDDVMTTGSTLSECASVLLKAGASSVDVLVAARRQRI